MRIAEMEAESPQKDVGQSPGHEKPSDCGPEFMDGAQFCRIKQELPDELPDGDDVDYQAYQGRYEVPKDGHGHLGVPIKVEGELKEDDREEELHAFMAVDVKLECDGMKQEFQGDGLVSAEAMMGRDVKKVEPPWKEQEAGGIGGGEEDEEEEEEEGAEEQDSPAAGERVNADGDEKRALNRLAPPLRTAPPAPAPVFRCADCDFTTTKQRYLTRHRKRKHSVGRLFQCSMCEYATAVSVYLNRHVRRYHEPCADGEGGVVDGVGVVDDVGDPHRPPPPHVALYRCEHCPFATRRRRVFFQHVRTLHCDVAEVFKCTQCDYISKNKRNLYAHTSIKHNDSQELYRCDRCDYTTNIKFYLTRHTKRSHPDDTSVQCAWCDHVAVSKDAMSEHVTDNHTRGNQLEVYACSRCEYETHFKKYLVQHFKRSHDGDTRTYRCTSCDYVTRHRGSLSVHMTVQHTASEESFACPHCDFTTSNKIYLSRHAKRHGEDARTYACTTCDYVAHFKKHLMEHMRRDHDVQDRVLKCPQCDYTTTQKSHMAVHANMKHESGELLVCTECDFNTTTRMYLTRHMKRVHGDKTYRCQQCSYQTTTKDSLTRHGLKHARQSRVYQCTECEYKTPVRSHMVYHVRRMHPLDGGKSARGGGRAAGQVAVGVGASVKVEMGQVEMGGQQQLQQLMVVGVKTERPDDV